MMDRRKLMQRMAWSSGAVLLLLVLFAHPFFAITRPSGAKVLVAEGWMHRDGMSATKRLFEEGGYEHLYVTGTLRPLVYQLLAGDTLDMAFDRPASGTLLLDLDGLPGASWSLEVNGLPYDSGVVQGGPWSVEINEGGSVSRARLVAHADGLSQSHPPLLFMGGWRVNGVRATALDVSVELVHADGRIEPARPSLAEEGVAVLRELGISEDLLTAVPSLSHKDRTRAAAMAMAQQAKEHGLKGYDVATLGVHARRTHRRHRQAAGAIPVGIISLDDPLCRRWTWWTSAHGWLQVGKELLAMPEDLWRTPHPTGPDQATGEH